MSLISVKNLSCSIGSNTLFENASFNFNHKTRLSLVGINGSGKSTFLKILAGLDEDSFEFSGIIDRKKGAIIEYVPQYPHESILEKKAVDVVVEHLKLIRNDDEDWKAYALLSSLNVSDDLWYKKMKELSGGEANTILLAKSLVVDPDIILMDEPTNHLDTEAIMRFEKFLLEEINVPFCIISHDRDLIDNVTTETIILRDKEFHLFGVPYSDAIVQLQIEDEAKEQRYVTENKEIIRLKETKEKMKNWVKGNSGLASRYQDIKKRIESKEENRTIVPKENNRSLGLSDNKLGIKTVLRIIDKKIVTPDGRLLYNVPEFTVNTGDRVFILGKNGAGKTTLLNFIYKSFIENNQNVKFNPQVELGYYKQDFSDIKSNLSIMEFFKDVDISVQSLTARLVSAGFPYERLKSEIKFLSGGEKARLKFLKMKLMNYSLVILDEPTNHIDVQGIDAMEVNLQESESSFITVSHDRRFISNTANKYYLIMDSSLIEINSAEDYYEYIETEFN